MVKKDLKYWSIIKAGTDQEQKFLSDLIEKDRGYRSAGFAREFLTTKEKAQEMLNQFLLFKEQQRSRLGV